MNCKYCYVPDYNRYTKSCTDTVISKSLILLSYKFGKEEFAYGLFCFRERESFLPTVKDLSEAVIMLNEHYIKSEINNLDVAIQSNAKRFTEDYLSELLYSIKNPDKFRLGFSIDPPKEIHDYLRDNSYDIVIRNYYKAIELGFPVSILSVVAIYILEKLIEFRYWMKQELANTNENITEFYNKNI